MIGWEDVRAEVIRRVRDRDWPPGATIPAETALAAEFGCARATVNRALRDLAEAGLLERRRRAGTRVALNPVRRATLAVPLTRAEIEGRGQRYGYALISDGIEPPPLRVASALGLPASGALRHVVAMHFADGVALVHEDRWLNPAALEAEPSFERISANEWLVAHVPFTTGEIAFSAAAADAAQAAALGLSPGAPLFVAERTTWIGAVPITFVRLSHAPGYRLCTRL